MPEAGRSGALRSLKIPRCAIAHLRFAFPAPRNDEFGNHAASAAMRALTILSGFCTGSPRLILSTFCMPDVTLPQTVYWLLRNEASSKQMKNWLSAEFWLAARAIRGAAPDRRTLVDFVF